MSHSIFERINKEVLSFLKNGDLAKQAKLASSPRFQPNGDLSSVQLFVYLTPREGNFKDTKIPVLLCIPSGYPSHPIRTKVCKRIMHPNITKKGNVCLNVLKSDHFKELNITYTIGSLLWLLDNPNFDSALNSVRLVDFNRDISKAISGHFGYDCVLKGKQKTSISSLVPPTDSIWKKVFNFIHQTTDKIVCRMVCKSWSGFIPAPRYTKKDVANFPISEWLICLSTDAIFTFFNEIDTSPQTILTSEQLTNTDVKFATKANQIWEINTKSLLSSKFLDVDTSLMSDVDFNKLTKKGWVCLSNVQTQSYSFLRKMFAYMFHIPCEPVPQDFDEVVYPEETKFQTAKQNDLVVVPVQNHNGHNYDLHFPIYRPFVNFDCLSKNFKNLIDYDFFIGFHKLCRVGNHMSSYPEDFRFPSVNEIAFCLSEFSKIADKYPQYPQSTQN